MKASIRVGFYLALNALKRLRGGEVEVTVEEQRGKGVNMGIDKARQNHVAVEIHSLRLRSGQRLHLGRFADPDKPAVLDRDSLGPRLLLVYRVEFSVGVYNVRCLCVCANRKQQRCNQDRYYSILHCISPRANS